MQGSERADALARIKNKSYSAVVEVGIKFDGRDVVILNDNLNTNNVDNWSERKQLKLHSIIQLLNVLVSISNT